MNLFNLVANSVLQLFKGDHILFLKTMTLVIVALWLFREINKHVTKDQNDIITRIDETLDVYGILESNITLYLTDEGDETRKELYRSIGSSYSHVTLKIQKNLMEYLDIPNNDKIRKILLLIRKETQLLKQKQSMLIPNIKRDSVIRSLIYYMDLISKIIKPVLITIIVFFISVFLVGWIEMFSQQITLIGKWIIVSYGILATIWIFNFLLIADFIDDKEFKLSKKIWIINIFIMILPFFLTKYGWYGGTICLIILFSNIVYMVHLKRSHLIENDN